jgi:thiopurine S-methyltransferase
MEYAFWSERWGEGRIGFHKEVANPNLETHSDLLKAGENTRVLVPLCGKTFDLAHLAQAGFDVVGVEFVEKAAQDFFDEQGLAYTVNTEYGHPIYSSPDVRIHVINALEVTEEEVGPVQAVYDRAALIALPPFIRKAYAEHVANLMVPGAKMLLLTVEYDQSKFDGPPFSVSEAEVLAFYGDGFEVEKLSENLEVDAPPRFAELDLKLAEKVWLITKKG